MSEPCTRRSTKMHRRRFFRRGRCFFVRLRESIDRRQHKVASHAAETLARERGFEERLESRRSNRWPRSVVTMRRQVRPVSDQFDYRVDFGIG